VELGGNCDGVEVAWARENGKVKDWDAVEVLWSHALEDVLSSDPREHPVLAACSNNESQKDREKLVEILFEKMEVPATFLARNAMLSAFSLGRASALVVDVGAAQATAVAVQDGFVLDSTLKVSCMAGDVVDEHLTGVLESDVIPAARKTAETAGSSTLPKQETDKGASNGVTSKGLTKPAGEKTSLLVRSQVVRNIHTNTVSKRGAKELAKLRASFLMLQKKELLRDLKSNVCRVWSELNYDEAKAALYAKDRYELPDGTIAFLGTERFKSTELLMNPELDKPFTTSFQEKTGVPATGLHHLLRDSLQSAHVDIRRDLAQQVILVGGGSVLPGTIERLNKELVSILPSGLKPRFMTPGKDERLFSTFTGGSILATLGSFQQLWISRQEFQEVGSSIVGKRCIH